MTTTVFTGGTIHTGVADDPCDWVMINGDTITATGEGEAPRSDRIVELDGATLVPAFRDAHVHLPATGLYARGMDFRGETSARRVLGGFADRAAADSEGILFGGNFEDPLDEPLLATDLDAAVGPRAALLARADMHSCIVSSALLEQLDLRDFAGVDRDENGVATGYLREQAASAAWTWFDRNLTPRQQRDAVLAAVALAYSKGIAEVHEMFVVEWRGWDSAAAFLETIDPLALEVVIYLGTDDVERVHEMGLRRIGGDWFLDGSFGSHTAWMGAPYESPPPSGSSPTGISYRSDDDVYDFFRRAQDRAMQVGVHAIGDAAISQAIAAWERVAREVGEEPVRMLHHRIEHFECATDEHIAAAARLGLIASVQPAFDRFWGGDEGLYAQRIGSARARTMNRFKTMLERGVDLVGGSDSTVTPLDPFLQMDALRRHHVPEESISPQRALSLMTFAAQTAAPTHGPRGITAGGSWADLALLDRDPLQVEGDDLLKTEVLGTWVRGKKVWPPGEAETQ